MAIAAVMGIDPTAVADTPEFQLGQLGAIIDDTSGTRIYKYVQYDTGSGSVAAVSGNAAYYYTLDGFKNHQVTSDLSDSVEIGAGILQSAPTDGQYCWVQIKGMATMAAALTAGADGDPLTATGSSDGKLDVTADVTSVVVAYAGDASDKEIICDFPM